MLWKIIAWLLGVIAGGVLLPGCINVHPRYPYDAVVWDESYLGTWVSTDEAGRTSTLVVEARPVRVDPVDRRLNPDDGAGERRGAGAAPGTPAPPAEISQYLLTFTGSDDESWVLEGYLLRAGEVRLLAFQRHDPFIEANAGWVVPLHFVWRVEMEGQGAGDGAGQTLSFAAPNRSVSWVPGIQWADAADDGGTRPIPREVPGRPGVRVAESLDRVLAYYVRHAGDPTFWETDGMRFTRRR